METNLIALKTLDELRIRMAFEIKDYAILLLDKKGRIQSWNQGASIITGFTEEEAIDKNFKLLFTPRDDSQNDPYLLLTHAFVNGHIHQKEWLRKKDGKLFWADLTITAIHNHDEEVIGFSQIIRDLTLEKINDDKLNALSERLLLATDASKTGIWDWNLINNTFILDDQMYKLYGVKKETFTPTYESLRSKVHPDDIKKTEKGIELALTGKKQISLDFRIILDDLSIRHIRMLAKVQLDEHGRAVRIVGTNMDITSFVKADEKFKNLLEAAPDAMVIVNEGGIIEIVNSQAEFLFEYSRQEMIGSTIEMILPEALRMMHVKHRKSFFKFPVRRPMGEGRNLIAQNKSGKVFPVEISLSPIEFENGTFVSAAIRDISKRVETENALRKYATLESKSKEMEQFAYIASHDLREPLITIKNYIHLINEDQQNTLSDQTNNYFSRITKAADRMEKLIIGLLEYSRLSKPKELSIIDSKQLINEIVQELHTLVASTGAKIIAESLPVLQAYPFELKLLFQNLISNAIKFRKKDVEPIIVISAFKINNGWQFSVKDNGIGIEEIYQEKIFSIFRKLHDPSEYDGTGIGLAYCRKITEIHGGTIWVKSKINEFSEFNFTILTDNFKKKASPFK